MAVYYGMFDDVRKYSAAEFARYLQSVSSPGVAMGIANALVPAAGPGLGVTVETGMALLQGYYYFQDGTSFTSQPSVTTVGNSRIDRIVVHLDINLKTVSIIRLAGVEAVSASAVPPAVTITSNIYEISLCQARVNQGATTPIVTDERPSAGPGVHDLITGHSKTGLTAGQVLKALTASTFGFGSMDHVDLANKGTQAHSVIDTHITAAYNQHGLPANVSVLGHKEGSGGFYSQRGAPLVTFGLGNAGSLTTYHIGSTSFPVAFSGTPVVVMGGNYSLGAPCAVTAPNTSGFTIWSYDATGAGAGGGGNAIQYIAIGS